jgi:chromate transporter
LFLTLSFLTPLTHNDGLEAAGGFFRSGALVFGGGHVILPLLEPLTVPRWMTDAQFLAGYSFAQAVPGPLFTFAAYLGATAFPSFAAAGAALATVAIFLPAFLLVSASLPFWNLVRKWRWFRAALTGINAAVVGILAAALYSPIGTTALTQPADAVLALVGFGLLTVWKLPPWVVVLVSAGGGALLSLWGL